jgi:hypothetical protein
VKSLSRRVSIEWPRWVLRDGMGWSGRLSLVSSLSLLSSLSHTLLSNARSPSKAEKGQEKAANQLLHKRAVITCKRRPPPQRPKPKGRRPRAPGSLIKLEPDQPRNLNQPHLHATLEDMASIKFKQTQKDACLVNHTHMSSPTLLA